MKRTEATQILAKADRQWGLYVYLKNDLAVLFQENGDALTRTLTSLVKADILTRAAHRIYVFAFSTHIGDATLDDIARCLRPMNITWESLESALSQWGVISQIPIGRVTYMTTGRSATYDTPFGVIELTHSKLSADQILPNLVFREGRLPLAKKQFAYENLKSTRRNLHLVDMEELEYDDDEQ